MPKETLALLIGGILPALLFGVSSVFQKTAAKAGITTGPYLICIGLVVVVAGMLLTFMQEDTTATQPGIAHACAYGVLWAAGIACIALSLARYDARISQLVPLYNLNTLVAVGIGLAVLGEWREINVWRLLVGALLAVLGGVLAATSTR
jgi:uncharacterized membrane protein